MRKITQKKKRKQWEKGHSKATEGGNSRKQRRKHLTIKRIAHNQLNLWLENCLHSAHI